jgi:hypothetical protein
MAALQADLVRSFLDGDYAAQLVVVTPESELENPKQ